ncbi:hypothetical protein L596_000939 [Steinernema carpocapsae]|uniref:HTH OST-type domain-containing protein n=1 Tax=Steinernema carpocapsae TaxID=34508 RepID=A0A4U8UKV2_STECR|nr:hypothetical protein L596_000939 [Steinernema carpocapsae]
MTIATSISFDERLADFKDKLRSSLIPSGKEGLCIDELEKSYRLDWNEELPHHLLGFDTIEKLLAYAYDTVTLKKVWKRTYVIAIPDENTCHVADLVYATRQKKKQQANGFQKKVGAQPSGSDPFSSIHLKSYSTSSEPFHGYKKKAYGYKDTGYSDKFPGKDWQPSELDNNWRAVGNKIQTRSPYANSAASASQNSNGLRNRYPNQQNGYSKAPGTKPYGGNTYGSDRTNGFNHNGYTTKQTFQKFESYTYSSVGHYNLLQPSSSFDRRLYESVDDYPRSSSSISSSNRSSNEEYLNTQLGYDDFLDSNCLLDKNDDYSYWNSGCQDEWDYQMPRKRNVQKLEFESGHSEYLGSEQEIFTIQEEPSSTTVEEPDLIDLYTEIEVPKITEELFVDRSNLSIPTSTDPSISSEGRTSRAESEAVSVSKMSTHSQQCKSKKWNKNSKCKCQKSNDSPEKERQPSQGGPVVPSPTLVKQETNSGNFDAFIIFGIMLYASLLTILIYFDHLWRRT